jgi:hypothetical protein
MFSAVLYVAAVISVALRKDSVWRGCLLLLLFWHVWWLYGCFSTPAQQTRP